MEVTRRQFLKGAAVVGGAVAVLPVMRLVPRSEIEGEAGTRSKTWTAVSGNTMAVEFSRTPTGLDDNGALISGDFSDYKIMDRVTMNLVPTTLEPRLVEWTDGYTGPDSHVFTPSGGDVTVIWHEDGRYAFR